MSRRFAKTALVILLAVGAAAGGYALYWYAAATAVESGIERWVAERRAAGWTVELGEPEITGFPDRIDVRLRSPRLAGAGGSPAWQWQLPDISATTRPWEMQRVVVTAPGRHSIETGDGPVEIATRDAGGELSVAGNRIRRVLFRISGIRVGLPGGRNIRAGSLDGQVEAAQSGGPAASADPETVITLDARKVRLPDEWHAPLGDALGRASVDAVVTGDFRATGSLPEALARWRDDGGALQVKALAVDWQALSFRADGTFALDENLQPQGAMTAEIDGVDQTADALIAAGIIDPKTAFAAKVANRALKLGGGPARLPVTIQQQQLFLGPVPLLKLRAIRWN
jgi:hypothetical protein